MSDVVWVRTLATEAGSGSAKMAQKVHGLMVVQMDTNHGQAEQKLNIFIHFNKTAVLCAVCWVVFWFFNKHN